MKRLLYFIYLLSAIHFCFAQNADKSLIEYELVYSALPWVNLSGGIDQGFVYMDNADVTAKVNFNQLFNWEQDLSVFLYGLGNHGGQATDLMGDFQVASNIQALRSWRLFEAWIQENFLKDRVSILVGLYDLNSEFDVLRPGTVFVNSSFGIGAEYAQTGLNGPSIFPVSSLGLRLSTSVTEQWKLRFAALDGVPGDPEDLKSNRIHLSQQDGALLALENSVYLSQVNTDNINRGYNTRRKKVGREQEIPTNDKVNFGAWMFTSKATDPWDSLQSHTNWGAYLGFQKYMFYSALDDRYVSIFGRYGIAQHRVNRLGSAISGGLVFAGSLSEKTDYLGIAFSTAINGERYETEFPMAKKAETVLELTYSFPFRKWLTIQPDLQYVINPGTGTTLKNPLAIALLVQASVGGAW